MLFFVFINDYLLCLLFWELLGISSYLLLNFWSNKNHCGIMALIYNNIRFGIRAFIGSLLIIVLIWILCIFALKYWIMNRKCINYCTFTLSLSSSSISIIELLYYSYLTFYCYNISNRMDQDIIISIIDCYYLMIDLIIFLVSYYYWPNVDSMPYSSIHH